MNFDTFLNVPIFQLIVKSFTYVIGRIWSLWSHWRSKYSKI